MPQKFRFLCGHIRGQSYIFATKFCLHPWHYFDEQHSIISAHDTLPSELKKLVATIKELEIIEIILDEDIVNHYYKNGKFIFKNIELKTFAALTKQKSKSTRDVTFNSGETNPLLFLAVFEKCSDIETDQHKTYKIRDFVDQEHKPEFSQLHFTSDWATVKTAFIKKYSLPFIENKKKELNFTFYDAPNLRSFVHRKFVSLTKYTTLPLINQMEIVLNELPNEIAHLLIVNEVFDCSKTDILDFCDAIQELVDKHVEDKNIQDDVNEPMNRMEVFNYQTDDEDDPEAGPSASASRGRGGWISDRGERGKGRTSTGKIEKCQTRKRKLNSIPEDPVSETEEYDFLDEISNSSSSVSSVLSCKSSLLSRKSARSSQK